MLNYQGCKPTGLVLVTQCGRRRIQPGNARLWRGGNLNPVGRGLRIGTVGRFFSFPTVSLVSALTDAKDNTMAPLTHPSTAVSAQASRSACMGRTGMWPVGALSFGA